MLSLLFKNYFNKLIAANLNGHQRLQQAVRALSTHHYYSTSLAGETVYKKERRECMAVFPDFVRSLTEYASQYASKDDVKLYEKALKYNLMGKRSHAGIFTVLAYKELADKTELNSENIKLSQYLGLCVDMVQCSGFILDDIIDESVTRSGKLCWHMLEDVGLSAINDSLMMLNGTYYILKENFAQKDYYVKLLELFQEMIFIGILGQSMDTQASKSCVTTFTMDRYKSIIANKCCYFGFYFPVALTMHLCGFTDPEVFRQTRAILFDLGNFVQIENDIKDCFGDPKQTGKIGNDIQENKCTWLAVVCMEKSSEAQKEIMRECYGKSDPVKIAQVKHLYEELGLLNIFTAYKEETYNTYITQSQLNSGTISSRLYKILVHFISRNNRADLIGSAY